MREEYLEDATPCTECGEIPFERIAKAAPIYLCNIALDGGYGTMLICGKCGKKTFAHDNPQDAYREWNEDVNKKK